MPLLPTRPGTLWRDVFWFGLPLVLGLACHATFSLVDTLLVGQLGEVEGAHAIAVTGLCDPITTFQTILFNGPIAGAGVIVAARKGAGDLAAIREIALRGTGLMILISVVLGVPCVIFSEPISAAMGARAGLQLDDCSAYLKVMMGGGFSVGLFLFLTTFERALGRTATFMGFFLLSNALNLVIGLFLVYGAGPVPEFVPDVIPALCERFNIPRMGVLGSAWSSVLARVLSVVGLVILGLWFGYLRGAVRWLLPWGAKVREICRLGLWNNGQVAARGLAGGIMIRVMQEAGRGAPEVIGGVVIGLKVELFILLLSFGWGAASQTLVATSRGAGQIARSKLQERWAVGYAAGLGVILTLPVMIWAENIAAWFNDSRELQEFAAMYLRLMAPAFVLGPVNVVISQTMVSRDQERVPVILDSVMLLGLMGAAMGIAWAMGAPPAVVVGINMGANVLLTFVYLVVKWRLSVRAKALPVVAD